MVVSIKNRCNACVVNYAVIAQSHFSHDETPKFGEDFISSSFITVKAIDFDFIPKFRFWLEAAAYSAATNCRILFLFYF